MTFKQENSVDNSPAKRDKVNLKNTLNIYRNINDFSSVNSWFVANFAIEVCHHF